MIVELLKALFAQSWVSNVCLCEENLKIVSGFISRGSFGSQLQAHFLETPDIPTSNRSLRSSTRGLSYFMTNVLEKVHSHLLIYLLYLEILTQVIKTMNDHCPLETN